MEEDIIGKIDIGETIKSNIDYWRNLYFKEKEKREIAEENHKVLILDNAQAFKEIGLPEDIIVADELVLEINKRYISKDKVKEKIEELERQAEEVKNHYKGTYGCLDEYLNAKSKIQGYKELLED